jgi:outer membrane beta-barrel protein
MTRLGTFAFLLLLAAPAFAQSRSEEEAGDVSEVEKDASGPLRDRVRPVSGHLFRMKGRFELAPDVGISFSDAFFTKYAPGIAAIYHFNDDFAVGVHAAYAFNKVSGAAQVCSSDPAHRGCEQPSAELLTEKNAFGQITTYLGLELQWSPIYGKVGLSSEFFPHFNMYLALGPTAVMYKGGVAGSNDTRSMFTLGGDVGIGFRFVINRWLAFKFELRDLLYVENMGPGKYETSFRNQLMFQLGFAFFFPLNFKEE